MVVEDDAQIREIIGEALTAGGYRVMAAGNGAEALAILRDAGPPDLIILDWIMPVMGGQEVLTTLAADPAYADMPVLVLSALDRPFRAKGLPVAVVLTKPVRMRTLVEIVDRLAGMPARPSPFRTGRFPAIPDRPGGDERAPATTVVLRSAKPTPPNGGEGRG